MKRSHWVLMVVAAAVGALAIQYRSHDLEPITEWPTTWRPRMVRGVVTVDGVPVPGARVTAYNEHEAAAETVSGADGAFELPWHPFVAARLDQRGAFARFPGQASPGGSAR